MAGYEKGDYNFKAITVTVFSETAGHIWVFIHPRISLQWHNIIYNLVIYMYPI